jgi:glycosyltransferase involved in cell wall biosynthesis
MKALAVDDVAIVAIGRNEGERLVRSLTSCLKSGCAVIYVDSNSSDGSVERARSLGATVIELDMSIPFSAARARNAGFEKIAPAVKYVQFLDGDCELVSGWIDRAKQELESNGELAVVCGRRRERFPEKSIYNRLIDVEWATPVGFAKNCGGDSLMRAEMFRAVGGFDPSVPAGEEPELCQRLRNKGWKILRIDAEMTLHDAALYHFSQWWTRSVRAGYAAMDVSTRFGSQGLYVSHVRSARIWTIGWAVAVVIAGIVAAVAGRFIGPAASLLPLIVVLTLPLQTLKVAINIRHRTGGSRDAVVWAVLTMLTKWANLQGQLACMRDRRNRRGSRLIEYKQDGEHPLPVAGA